jgi:GntR family transcriptional regulator, transcriptional repressor for pyruvate dehydrogenase complex
MSGIRFAPLEKHRLSDLIVDRITDLIGAGEYQIGMRLPSERELARSFEVSRPLVREALRIAESLGLIEVRPGIGAIVTHNGPETANVAGYFCKHPIEVLAMLEAREVLLIRIAALAADRMTDLELHALKQIYMDQIAVSADEDIAHIVRLDQEFHDCIYRAARSPILYEAVQYTQSALDNQRTNVLTLGTRRAQSLAEHAQIVAALEAHDPKLAAARAKTHMRCSTAKIRKLMRDRIGRASEAQLLG